MRSRINEQPRRATKQDIFYLFEAWALVLIMRRYIIILFLWFSIYSVEGQSSDSVKIDSVFNYNIAVLDMFQKDTRSDSTGASIRAVYILERMTGIMSNGRITYLGKVGFDAEDLCKWRAWYAKNKADLLWDPKYKIVRRRSY